MGYFAIVRAAGPVAARPSAGLTAGLKRSTGSWARGNGKAEARFRQQGLWEEPPQAEFAPLWEWAETHGIVGQTK